MKNTKIEVNGESKEKELNGEEVIKKLPAEYPAINRTCGVCGHYKCICYTPLGYFAPLETGL